MSYINQAFNNTSFGKGYNFPRPLISKLSIISALQNKYRYISLTFDLFQNYPELFKKTSTNLIYLLQTGTTFKKEAIFTLFESLLNSSQEISINQANKLLNLEESKQKLTSSSNSFIETQSLMILYSYYLYKYKEFNYFEPAMKGIKEAMDSFKNNDVVYYKGNKFNFSEFKPLCYNNNGDNLYEFIPYFCFVATFYSDGQPYRFFEEIGSETSYNNLLVSIDNYFSNYYKLFMKQIGLSNYTANFNDYPIFINTIFEDRDESGVKTVAETLQSMLNNMLSFDNLIKLRNDEMNKSASLLDDNFNDQNRLSDEFLKECYLRNIDLILEIIIEKNPIQNILNQFPTFVPVNLSSPFQNYSLSELSWMTHYCLSSGNHKFFIDDEYKFRPIIEDNVSTYSFVNSKDPWKVNTKINKFKYSMNLPFSDCDLATQMLTSFIKQRIVTAQENFLDTPDLSSSWMPNEEISITLSDFTENSSYFNDLTSSLLNLYLSSNFVLNQTELNTILPNLLNINKKYKEYIDNLLNFVNIAPKIYPNVVGSICVNVLLMSYIKDLLTYHLDTQYKNGLELNLNNFNLYKYLMKFVILEEDIDLTKRMYKIYNMLVSLVIINNDSYCRFVNTCITDFNKYLEINSLINMSYLSGNDDEVDNFCIGGINLYDKMIDPNCLNRGYYYLLQTLGINEKIETIHYWTKKMNDPNLNTLLMNSVSDLNRFKAISLETFETLRETNIKQNTESVILSNFNFTMEGESLRIIYKSYIDWGEYTIDLNGSTYLLSQLMVLYGGTQVVGSYIDNIFKSKSFNLDKTGVIMPDATILNSFKYGNKHIAVSVNYVNNSNYVIPLYKYQGNMIPINLTFNNPPGYKLLVVTLDSTSKDKNNVIFMFTKANLDNGYNYYIIG